MNRTKSSNQNRSRRAGVRNDDSSVRHWFLPPLNPLLSPTTVSKPCFKIAPFVYDRPPYKTRAIQGWHDVHRQMFANPLKMGAPRLRRQTHTCLPDYTQALSCLEDCSSDTPCGLALCPYCTLCLNLRNATLLTPHFENPVAFTLCLDPMTEEQFARQVLYGSCVERGKILDNPADHRWVNKNLAMRLRKHVGDTKIVLMPDIDWCPRTRVIKPHYHAMVDAGDTHAIKTLRNAYPGCVVYSKPVVDSLRYINYGQKTPLLRWKHLQEIHHVKEGGGEDLTSVMTGVNRLLLLWKALRPPMLLLGFDDREFVGKIRSTEFALTTALTWRPQRSD